MVSTEIANEPVTLLGQGGLFWPRGATLLVADVHLGKAATFRAAGLPVPEAVTATDLARLSAAIAATGARRLIILGDLLHARAGRQTTLLSAVSAWRADHAELELTLVRGNHDRWAGDPPTEWGVRCVDQPLVEAPFEFRHEPREPCDRSRYVLAGHLHPSVPLVGPGRQRLRLPCFHLRPQVGVLPAFSRFTGGSAISVAVGDRVFALADGQVLEVGRLGGRG